jgi:hypothetical protein
MYFLSTRSISSTMTPPVRRSVFLGLLATLTIPLSAIGQHAPVGGVGAYYSSIADTMSTLGLSVELGAQLSENYQAVLRGLWWNSDESRIALGAFLGGRLPMNRHLYGDVGLSLIRVGSGTSRGSRLAFGAGVGWIMDLSESSQLRLLATLLRDNVEPTYGFGAAFNFRRIR